MNNRFLELKPVKQFFFLLFFFGGCATETEISQQSGPDFQLEDPRLVDFFILNEHSHQSTLVYAPTYYPHCPICYVSRTYRPAIAINLPTIGNKFTNQQLALQLIDDVHLAFLESAQSTFDGFHLAEPLGWSDERNEICRKTNRRRSAVLKKSYYEDNEYCVAFLPIEHSSGLLFGFRIRIEANINVTKNPKSPYRQGDAGELEAYEDLIRGFESAIKVGIQDKMLSLGWIGAKSRLTREFQFTGYVVPHSDGDALNEN